FERMSGFEPEKPTTDHGARFGGLRPSADRVDVVDRAIDEAAGKIAPVDGGHEWRGAGRQHELVVRNLDSRLRDDPFGRTIDRHHSIAEVRLDMGRVEEPWVDERKILRRHAVEERREGDPIVAGAGLFAEYRHRKATNRSVIDQALEEPVPHHAVADDD